jgi:5-methylcytosine-specific restriction enzyme A
MARCVLCARPAVPNGARCPKHLGPTRRKGGWPRRADLHSAAWTELSRRIRAERPVCEIPGCSNPSASVDHVVPVHLGGTDDLSNLRALCHPHHQRKSAQEGARARARKRRS